MTAADFRRKINILKSDGKENWDSGGNETKDSCNESYPIIILWGIRNTSLSSSLSQKAFI